MKLEEIRKLAFTEADIQANINQRQNIANAFGGNRASSTPRPDRVIAPTIRRMLGTARNISQQVKASSLSAIRSRAAMDIER